MENVFARDREEWRRWLAKNHGRSQGVWLVFYKKSSGSKTISYDHAVEEALCFGWIDGMKKKLDEQCYAYRFTPRQPKSRWSQSNLARVERLIEEGKMTRAGLNVYNASERREAPAMPIELPKRLEEAFRNERSAWSNYQKFPRGYRQMTAGWVASAKKEETQLKRLGKLIEYSTRNERIEFM